MSSVHENPVCVCGTRPDVGFGKRVGYQHHLHLLRFYGNTCKTSVIADQPRDYAQEAADEAAKQERIRKWETFCKPTRTYDSEGVIRLVYARKGCEFGRSE